MTYTANIFNRIAAVATAAALSFLMISATVATPQGSLATDTTSATNVSVLA